MKLGGTLDLTGSSPHTRGAPSFTLMSAPLEWIIPAYAGSTAQRRGLHLGERDHPRIRGEHLSLPNVPGSMVGSSPHTRGALGSVISNVVAWGIIPAYAGSTSLRPPRPCSPWDHPRIRGEHV